MGFKIILLTGRTEYHRNATAKNLVYAGFNDWERLILRYVDQLIGVMVIDISFPVIEWGDKKVGHHVGISHLLPLQNKVKLLPCVFDENHLTYVEMIQGTD